MVTLTLVYLSYSSFCKVHLQALQYHFGKKEGRGQEKVWRKDVCVARRAWCMRWNKRKKLKKKGERRRRKIVEV
jgi:hypothetical protein